MRWPRERERVKGAARASALTLKYTRSLVYNSLGSRFSTDRANSARAAGRTIAFEVCGLFAHVCILYTCVRGLACGEAVCSRTSVYV